MFEIITLEVSPFMQNSRILLSSVGQLCVVIDPGAEAERIFAEVQKRGYSVSEIWLTHSHLDHCGGVAHLIRLSGAKLRAHLGESVFRAKVEEIAKMYGVPPGIFENCPEPDFGITGGDKVSLGPDSFDVLYTPGHSPGHVCFYHAGDATLIAGDTLFAGSIGRTDLPGGDHKTLIRSIREKILVLPGTTKVLPGHGPDTTVAQEARTNPFLQE